MECDCQHEPHEMLGSMKIEPHHEKDGVWTSTMYGLHLQGNTEHVNEEADIVISDVKQEIKEDEANRVMSGPGTSVLELAKDGSLCVCDLADTLGIFEDNGFIQVPVLLPTGMDPVVSLEKWQCGSCGQCQPCPEWLDRHKKSECKNYQKQASQRTRTTSTGLKKFRCHQCSYSTNYRSNYDDHLAVHTGHLRYKCKVCQKLFKCSAHRRRHMRSKHGPKTKYKCEFCGKQCPDRRSVKRCEMKHTNIRPYNCNHCGKGFIEKGDLSRHMKMHTKEKPYSCPTCGRKFAFLYHVTRHQSLHRLEKPYCCGECNKTYKTSGSLESHIQRLHSEPTEGTESG